MLNSIFENPLQQHRQKFKLKTHLEKNREKSSSWGLPDPLIALEIAFDLFVLDAFELERFCVCPSRCVCVRGLHAVDLMSSPRRSRNNKSSV